MSDCCDNFRLEEYVEQFDMSSCYMRGPAGPQGPTGPQGPQGEQGDTGEGVPAGGSPFQVLLKKSSTDYDTEWSDALLNAMPHDTASGSIASFPDGADNVPVKALSCAINFVQDLHGYANPFPYGSTKNVIDNRDLETLKANNTAGSWSGNRYTLNGVTFTVNGDGTYTASGIASALTSFYIYGSASASEALLPSSTEYIVSGAIGTGKYIIVNGYASSNVTQITTEQTFTTKSTAANGKIILRINSGTDSSGTFKPMIRLSSVADSTFVAGSNICPITGHTGANVHLADGENPHIIDNVYPISWNTEAGTVYGGTLDVTTGVLTVTNAFIASYNGESINEPWISSMDAYVAGTTPTTGAQVVYPLTTPLTYQLTPTEVKTLLGQNNLWHDANGDTSVEYYADTTLYIEKKIAAAIAAALNS